MKYRTLQSKRIQLPGSAGAQNFENISWGMVSRIKVIAQITSSKCNLRSKRARAGAGRADDLGPTDSDTNLRKILLPVDGCKGPHTIILLSHLQFSFGGCIGNLISGIQDGADA